MELNTKKEIVYHPIEISVEKVGETIKIEQPLPLLFDRVKGVLVLNPGGDCGGGTLSLSIGGEEVFPDTFHAESFMYHQSNNPVDEIMTKELDSYMHPVNEKAKGATIKASYQEPEDGAVGVLYLILKLTKQVQCK